MPDDTSLLSTNSRQSAKQLCRETAPCPSIGFLATFLASSLASSLASFFGDFLASFLDPLLASQPGYIAYTEYMEAIGQG